MAKAKATVLWNEKFHLTGKTQSGFEFNMDSAAGGQMKGPSPKELVLHALAGCTMMDVVVMIQKSKKDLKKFRVDVDAETAETHPKKYLRIHLKYNFLSEDLDDATADRVIKLSKETYCSVSAMLKDTVELSHNYEIFRNEDEFEKQNRET
jgi:putative redox protein